jgi:hypothetical protein
MTERHPKFVEAMQRIESLRAAGLTDSEDYRLLHVQAYHYAPDELKARFDEIFRKHFGTPPASYYDEHGEPVYTPDDIARFLGITVKEVIANTRKLEARGMSMSVESESLSRKQ